MCNHIFRLFDFNNQMNLLGLRDLIIIYLEKKTKHGEALKCIKPKGQDYSKVFQSFSPKPHIKRSKIALSYEIIIRNVWRDHGVEVTAPYVQTIVCAFFVEINK